MTTPTETEVDSNASPPRGGKGRKAVGILAGIVVAIIGYIIVKAIWNAVLKLIVPWGAALAVGIIGDIVIVIGAIAVGVWIYRVIR